MENLLARAQVPWERCLSNLLEAQSAKAHYGFRQEALANPEARTPLAYWAPRNCRMAMPRSGLFEAAVMALRESL
jgi:hypothetical protein